jgi:5-methyltetrahydropteroyltriglutamate--homocysteine methyltransferase
MITPNIPTVDQIVNLISKAAERQQSVYKQTGCSLKTRRREEVKAALEAMVTASKVLRSNSAAA